MKKITKEAVEAFFNGECFAKDNTTVGHTKTESKMFLHGNLIARAIRPQPGRQGMLEISSAGWETPTTKERLNGILDHVKVGRIFAKSRVWYWKNTERFEQGFNKVCAL